MYLFFVHSYVASKVETQKKMKDKVRMVRLNLSSDDARNIVR